LPSKEPLMATFIIVGIVLVPIVLLVADLLVGRQRLTAAQQRTRRR
jgi:hypothetical protein